MSDETVIATPPAPPPPTPPTAPPDPPARSSPPPGPTPAPRPRKRRWFLRLFVLTIVLLLVGGGLLAGVQWALQNTDYARRIALPIVEQQLGLRLNAKGLKVSLLGHTELTDVDVGLPLDKANFLHVPSIRVRHANLLGIILARAVTLDDVTIDKPTVDVVQDADGQWNLLSVVDILGRLGGSNNAQPTATSGGVPKLPAVHLIDGTINLADNGTHRVKIYPLNVDGQPQDQLVWKYDLAAGPKGAEFLKVGGVVAPGGSWTHEVTADVGHLDPLAQALGVPSTYGAAIRVTLDGGLHDGKYGATLKLKQVSASGVPSLGNVAVTGSVDVTTGGTAAPAVPGAPAALAPLVTLTPSNLMVLTTSPTVPTVGVATGAITYDAAGIHTRGLKVNVLGGATSLDASVDPKTQNVDLTAHWTGLTVATDVSQAGSLTASVRQPFPGQPLIRVELDDRGAIGATAAATAKRAATTWDAGVQVVGQGTSWTSIDWVLAVPRLNVVSSDQKYDLSGLSAQVRQTPTTVDLLSLTLPPATGASSAATVALGIPSSRITTGQPTPAPGGGGGGSPYGLSFASSAHVTLPDASAHRPLSWRASLNAGLTASYQGTPVPVTLALEADGDEGLYALRKFALTAADANVNVVGEYNTSRPKPVSLHVELTQTPRLTPDAPVQGTFTGAFDVVGLLLDYDPIDDAIATAAAAIASTQPTTGPSASPAEGAAALPTSGPASTMPAVVAAIASTTAPTTGPTAVPVHGRRWHPYLTISGKLNSNDLVVFGKPIGDIGIELDGDVKTVHPPKTANGPEAADALPPASEIHVAMHADHFALLQSKWNLQVEYPNADHAAEVNLDTADLPLDVLEKAAGMAKPPVEGVLSSAHWKVTATGPGIGDVRLASEYRLTRVIAGGLAVDSIDAAASFADGVARLDPVTARSGTGVTHVSASYALARPTHVLAKVDVVRWPYALGSALGGITNAEASAKVDLDVDLANKGAAGTASGAVDVVLNPTVAGQSLPQNLAHAQLAATLRGQSVDVSDLSGRVLNGTFQGSAQVDVGKPLEAAGRVQWQDVDAGALATITGNTGLKDLGGVFSGTVTIAPSRDPRSLEPVRIDVNVAARNGHYATVMLGDKTRLLMTHAVAYANLDRAVLDHSDIYVAGGIVHVWGRVGRNLSSQTVIVDYNDISIDQLAHVIPNQAKGPVPGTLAGEFGITRNGSGLDSLIGGGHTNIADCDLVNIPAIGQLYGMLGHGGDTVEPVGTGGLDLAVEAGTVRINGLRYFNHGLEAKGIIKVGPLDLTDIKATPLDGQITGAARDLKNSRISFLSDFDDLTNAIQSGLAAVNIRGTLGKPVVSQAGLDDLGKGLKELLAGDAQASQSPQ